jgi:hypothetical protein
VTPPRRVPWKLTVRAGPRVEHRSFEALGEALAALEARAGELTSAGARRPVDTKLRRFEPAQQVAARLEVAGPQRLAPSVRGGLDVHGDGSLEAYTGWVRRQVVERRRGESAYQALARALHAAGGEAP